MDEAAAAWIKCTGKPLPFCVPASSLTQPGTEKPIWSSWDTIIGDELPLQQPYTDIVRPLAEILAVVPAFLDNYQWYVSPAERSRLLNLLPESWGIARPSCSATVLR